MSDIAKIVGIRIRNLRNKKGWSQERLAHQAGIHPSHLGRLERGEKSATLDSLEKVINALEITFEELFRYVQPSSGNADNITLSLLIDKLNTLNSDDQKLMLDLFDVLFMLMKRK